MCTAKLGAVPSTERVRGSSGKEFEGFNFFNNNDCFVAVCNVKVFCRFSQFCK